jgi:hypothetical protein
MSPLFAPPVRNFGAPLSSKDVQAGWSGKAPTLETVIRYQQAPLSSALDCANVKSRAEKRGKIVSYQAGRSELDRMGLKFGKTRYLYQVSMPVISQNGEEAIVEIASSSNHLFGGVDLTLLSRRNGQWVIVGRKALLLG